MADHYSFNTPVGRLVYGSLTDKRTKDSNDRPIDPDKQRYEIGVAFSKQDPAFVPMLQGIAQHAKGFYAARAPHIAQKIDQWFQTLDGFSMKVSDGNKPNARGQVNKNTVDHWVMWFSTSIDIVGARVPDNAQIPLSDIKRGYYVDVAGTSAPHELVDHNAGVYINPVCVRLVGMGDEIVGSADPNELFANTPAPALPPGARPIGSAPAVPASSGTPGTAMGMPGMGAPAVPNASPAGMPSSLPGAPAGMPGAAPVASQGTPTASPSNFPPYSGMMGQPQ